MHQNPFVLIIFPHSLDFSRNTTYLLIFLKKCLQHKIKNHTFAQNNISFIQQTMLATSQNNQKITAKIFGSLSYFDRHGEAWQARRGRAG